LGGAWCVSSIPTMASWFWRRQGSTSWRFPPLVRLESNRSWKQFVVGVSRDPPDTRPDVLTCNFASCQEAVCTNCILPAKAPRPDERTSGDYPHRRTRLHRVLDRSIEGSGARPTPAAFSTCRYSLRPPSCPRSVPAKDPTSQRLEHHRPATTSIRLPAHPDYPSSRSVSIPSRGGPFRVGSNTPAIPENSRIMGAARSVERIIPVARVGSRTPTGLSKGK
jgi:hypothetical protein